MQRFTHVPAWQAHSVNYNPKSICHSDNPNAGQYSEETQRCHYQKKQIAPWDLRFIAFSDASFASKAKPESYAGMIILATHKDIAQNKSCVINPLYWGTKKQKFSELWQARCLQKHLRYPPLLINWLGYECIGYGCSTQPFTGKNPETIHTLP